MEKEGDRCQNVAPSLWNDSSCSLHGVRGYHVTQNSVLCHDRQKINIQEPQSCPHDHPQLHHRNLPRQTILKMAVEQNLYPRATVKKIVKAHSKRNLSKNVDVLVRILDASRTACTDWLQTDIPRLCTILADVSRSNCPTAGISVC